MGKRSWTVNHLIDQVARREEFVDFSFHLISCAATPIRPPSLGCKAADLLALSGDWLHALPSGTLGLRLNDDQLTTAIALRLGAPGCSAHICVCGAEVEQSAQHAFVCHKLKSRHARHRLGNNIILRALKTADVPATLEPLGLSRSDGKRPDGASLLP